MKEKIAFIRTVLQVKVRMQKKIGHPPSFESLMLRHGRAFSEIDRHTKYPKWVRIQHGCFANCMRLVEYRSRFGQPLTYVEGIAVQPGSGVELEHAWCIDDARVIHDPTWKCPGVAYFGVPFATRYVVNRLKSQMKWGELGSLLRSGDDGFAILRGVEPAAWIEAHPFCGQLIKPLFSSDSNGIQIPLA